MVREQCPFVTAVESAASADEALEAIRENPPDTLLADINMPGQDGLTMVEEVRREHPRMVVIIVTGYDRFSYAKRAIDLGASGFLLKPVDRSELRQLMRSSEEQIRARTESALLQEWSTRELSTDLSLHQARFLERLLTGKLSDIDIEIALDTLALRQFGDGWLVTGLLRDLRSTTAELQRSIAEENRVVVIGTTIEETYALYVSPKEPMTKQELMASISAREHDGPAGQWEIRRVGGEWRELPRLYSEAIGKLRSLDSPLVRHAQSVMKTHYSDPSFSLREAAELLQVSPSHLSHEFRRVTHETFVEALTALRVRAAAEELDQSEPGVKVYEVAQRNGFTSQHYFSRVFKRITGLAPKEYRRKR